MSEKKSLRKNKEKTKEWNILKKIVKCHNVDRKTHYMLNFSLRDY